MLEILLGLLLLFFVLGALWTGLRLAQLSGALAQLPGEMARLMEEKHRLMATELAEGLAKQGDRVASALAEQGERQRSATSRDLELARNAMHALELKQSESLGALRETMVRQLTEMAAATQERLNALREEVLAKLMQTLAEQGRAEKELIHATMAHATQSLMSAMEALTKTTDARLEQISGKVAERLDEGFKKTNDTFTQVMARLATIDEAQKKIDGLTTNVVSLQELLGDKRARGAFGEVQLEHLVRNALPDNPNAPLYAMQYRLSNGTRVDCVLFFPEPTGTVAVDSKFPLENYRRMFDPQRLPMERLAARKQFEQDVRKHIDDIAAKYIVPNETADGAVMFVPAEAVFAEIHGHHPGLVDYALQKRVWIASPTTMMAILNTARAVIKDVETRKQVHIIKEALANLAKDFKNFDTRMKKLADHIRQAHEDAQRVHSTSLKISRRFREIEAVELAAPEAAHLPILEADEEEEAVHRSTEA